MNWTSSRLPLSSYFLNFSNLCQCCRSTQSCLQSLSSKVWPTILLLWSPKFHDPPSWCCSPLILLTFSPCWSPPSCRHVRPWTVPPRGSPWPRSRHLQDHDTTGSLYPRLVWEQINKFLLPNSPISLENLHTASILIEIVDDTRHWTNIEIEIFSCVVWIESSSTSCPEMKILFEFITRNPRMCVCETDTHFLTTCRLK